MKLFLLCEVMEYNKIVGEIREIICHVFFEYDISIITKINFKKNIVIGMNLYYHMKRILYN